jgi:integrase
MPRRAKPARLRFREDRGVWVIAHKGRSISTGCSREDIAGAEGKLIQYLGEKHIRTWGAGDPADVPVADILAAYAEEVAAGSASAKTVGYHMANLLQMWGDDYADAVSPQSCRVYMARRTRSPVVENGRTATLEPIGRPVAPATVARELNTLRAACRHAVRHERMTRDRQIPVLAKSESRERWLTRQEAALAISGCLGFVLGPDGRLKRQHRPNYYIARFMLIALYTLSRHEVAATVRWLRSPRFPSIDPETGIMHRIGGSEMETKKRKGMLRIPERLIAHCRRWRRLTSEGPVEFRGRVMSNVGDGFAICMARVGLDDVTPHILKHTGVTWMMSGGRDGNNRVALEEIALYASTSVKTLVETYGHHQPDYLERARAAWR